VHVVCDPYADPAPLLDAHRPAVVLAEASDSPLVDALLAAAPPPRAAIWRGEPPAGQDLAWDVLMRAGRTDPAPVAEVAVGAEAFVVGDRTLTVGEVLEDDGTDWPLDAVVTLLDGGLFLLAMP
jgi:hypothetical protein